MNTEPNDDCPYCFWCEGSGTVSTGIAEASTTICNRCDGTGYAKKKNTPAAANPESEE